MLREDWEVRVIEIQMKSAEQADLFMDTAAHMESEDAAALCRERAENRRALATALEDALRRKGRLPKEMDPDRETAERWVTNIRSALSGNEGESLLRNRLSGDEALDSAIAAAMADRELPADLRDILDGFWTALDSERHALANFLASNEAPD